MTPCTHPLPFRRIERIRVDQCTPTALVRGPPMVRATCSRRPRFFHFYFFKLDPCSCKRKWNLKYRDVPWRIKSSLSGQLCKKGWGKRWRRCTNNNNSVINGRKILGSKSARRFSILCVDFIIFRCPADRNNITFWAVNPRRRARDIWRIERNTPFSLECVRAAYT